MSAPPTRSAPRARPAPLDDPTAAAAGSRPPAAGRLLPAVWGAATLLMVLGAANYFALAGVDLDASLQAGTLAEVLPDVVAASGTMSVTYVLWLAAMPLFAVAAWQLPGLPLRPAAVRAAGASLATGAAMAAVAFVVFLAVVQVAAPTGDVDLVTALAWLASTLDWVATPLVIAVPPALLVLVADEDHDVFAGWLRVGAALLVPATVAAWTAVALGTGLSTWGFVVVPIGIVVTLGVAATLWRQS